MQFFTTVAVALSIASTALAAPPPEPTVTRVTNIGAKATCVTKFTVTTSYPPRYQPYTTTVYKALAAIPHDLDCKGCSLKIVTQTINKSRKPDATVTAESTLLRIPMCYEFPTARPN
ncbi:hypothetical protein TWF281_001681 [Arthrobotrys megalospora]